MGGKKSQRAKSKKAEPKGKVLERRQQVKRVFLSSEVADLGKELARQQNHLVSLDADRKASASDFKAKMDSVKAEIDRLSNAITNGFTFEDVLCEIRLNDPKDGKKTVVRQDTGEIVGTYPMTAEERQESLAFDSEQEASTPSGDAPPAATEKKD